MNANQPTSRHEVVPRGRISQNRYAALLVGLTVVVGLATIVFVRPRVGRWLETWSAYRSLSSTDSDTRTDAIRRLRSLGEETESQLIALLHHPDEGVRRFAAAELAHRTEVTDNIIEAFLTALESDQHVAEIGHSAPALFVRYAADGTGPLTETDHRIISWLKSELNSTNPDRSGTAAWALTAFVNRDSMLRETLAAYLENATWFSRYLVLREMADIDPSLRDQYVDLLLSGLGSSVLADQVNAQYGLANLTNEPDDLRSRLEARREESTDPEEISRIDQALEELSRNSTGQP